MGLQLRGEAGAETGTIGVMVGWPAKLWGLRSDSRQDQLRRWKGFDHSAF